MDNSSGNDVSHYFCPWSQDANYCLPSHVITGITLVFTVYPQSLKRCIGISLSQRLDVTTSVSGDAVTADSSKYKCTAGFILDFLHDRLVLPC